MQIETSLIHREKQSNALQNRDAATEGNHDLLDQQLITVEERLLQSASSSLSARPAQRAPAAAEPVHVQLARRERDADPADLKTARI